MAYLISEMIKLETGLEFYDKLYGIGKFYFYFGDYKIIHLEETSILWIARLCFLGVSAKLFEGAWKVWK